jgi:adenosylmethionine-8-amino-7-oxononanoate aminotransferase
VSRSAAEATLGSGAPTNASSVMTDSYIWPLIAKDVVQRDGAVVLARGEGSCLIDVDGKRYIDLSSGITRAAALGYGHPDIEAAVARQLSRLQYAGTVDFQADVVFRLAERLVDLTPGRLSATTFTCSGTEANEAAFKLAQLYHRSVGRKAQAYKVISRWGAYHGAVGRAMAASDWLGVRNPSEPVSVALSRIPAPVSFRPPIGSSLESWNAMTADLLEQHILHEGPELVSAVIAEPVMQVNGVQIPPSDYFPRVREICDRHDVLLIADEVITGFGRTGKWFGMQHWDVDADIMTAGKALTGGYAPLGLATVRSDIWDAISAFPDVHTFGGHPLGAAAALAVIDVYERDSIVERAHSTGIHLLRGLHERLDASPIVGDVRGLGMWAAVDFVAESGSGDALPTEHVRGVALRARQLGVIVVANGTAIEIAPPLNIRLDDLDRGLDLLAAAIDEHRTVH